jgi:hypothetical protein
VARATLALALAAACLGGVAYAATQPDRERPSSGKKAGSLRGNGERPPRPRLIEVPPASGVGGGYQFRFHVAPPAQPSKKAGSGRSAPPPAPAVQWRQFECRLDDGDWDGCGSPRRLGGLAPGDHAFAVRALNRRGLSGPAAHYRWSQLEPKGFEVQLLGAVEDLMPGDPPRQLPLRIHNPNPAPIEVTSLTVSVAPEAPGCAADPNFAVVPASLSAEAPLTVPAEGATSLPSEGATAPSVALRELSTDQNACQGATLRLDFSGEARG